MFPLWWFAPDSSFSLTLLLPTNRLTSLLSSELCVVSLQLWDDSLLSQIASLPFSPPFSLSGHTRVKANDTWLRFLPFLPFTELLVSLKWEDDWEVTKLESWQFVMRFALTSPRKGWMPRWKWLSFRGWFIIYRNKSRMGCHTIRPFLSVPSPFLLLSTRHKREREEMFEQRGKVVTMSLEELAQF